MRVRPVILTIFIFFASGSSFGAYVIKNNIAKLKACSSLVDVLFSHKAKVGQKLRVFYDGVWNKGEVTDLINDGLGLVVELENGESIYTGTKSVDVDYRDITENPQELRHPSIFYRKVSVGNRIDFFYRGRRVSGKINTIYLSAMKYTVTPDFDVSRFLTLTESEQRIALAESTDYLLPMNYPIRVISRPE